MPQATVSRATKSKIARTESTRTKVAKTPRRTSVMPSAADEEGLVVTTLRLEPVIRRGLELLQAVITTRRTSTAKKTLLQTG